MRRPAEEPVPEFVVTVGSRMGDGLNEDQDPEGKWGVNVRGPGAEARNGSIFAKDGDNDVKRWKQDDSEKRE